jgi:hypothetical protein
MNAGIADAANLAWKLAAVLEGWASPRILDTFDPERRPITDQASVLITDIARKVTAQRDGISGDIERPDAVGEAARARVGEAAYALDVEQQCCGGLNFGYGYDRSPIIAYDAERQPAYTMGTFTSSTVPGCRAPHLWLGDGVSLYDALGPGYTLLRFDPTAAVAGIVGAAARRNVPLKVLDVPTPQARTLYGHDLVLVRPDQHVAWRGDEEPAEPLDLVDLIRGASTGPAIRSA